MSDSTEQKELIQQWLAVNPGTEEQAHFFLEANNWDLNAALSNFYEEPPLSEGLPPAYHQGDPALPPDPNLIPTGSDVHPPTAAPVASVGTYDVASSARQAPSTPSASVPRRRHGSGARIATLSSLSGPDSEDVGKPDEWYAGGEHSGMAVMPRGRDDDEHGDDSGGRRGSLVDRILRRASEIGGPGSGEAGEASEEPTMPKKRFAGRGHRLDSVDESVQESDSDLDDSSDDPDAEIGGNGGVAVRELTFWRNGFSIGNGPLHNIEDPVNRQNLEAILQGRAPLDVLNVRPGQQVEMRVTDRRSEDYVQPAAPPAKPFSGTGRRLGDLAPSITAGVSTGSSVQHAAPSASQIALDPSQPTVRVQIRLADGSRLIANVNPSHTIGDLRSFVAVQRPDAVQRPFVFHTVMPSTALSDDSATVAGAGIANAAIIQRAL